MTKSAHFPHVSRFLAAFLGACLLGVLALHPVHADTEAELDAAEAKLNKLIHQIEDGQDQIAALQGEASVIAGRMSEVESELAGTQEKILKKQEEIGEASETLGSTQGQLNRRAWVAYENGPGSGLEFILGSTSLADLTERLEIVDNAAQTDQDLIDQMRDLRTRLESKRKELEVLEASLAKTRRNLIGQQHQLEAKLSDAQAVVDELNRDKAEAEKIVSQLEAKRQREIEAAKRLAAALARQQQQDQNQGGGGGDPGPSVIGGFFSACPVDSPRGYSDDFGAPRWGGGPHPHAGNDIFAPSGTPIRAPFDGTAEDASNGLGGMSVKVYGSQGWVYNAHLSAMGQLGPVSAGTIVGYVGNSGDAVGGATHDHFEWHPGAIPSTLHVSPYGYSLIGDAVDPWPYLNSVC